MRILKPKTKYMYELKPASIFYNLSAVHLVMLARVCGCETVGVWAFTHVCEARNWYCPSSVTHHMLAQALTVHATKWNAEYPVHTHKNTHTDTQSLSSLTFIIPSSALFFQTGSDLWVQRCVCVWARVWLARSVKSGAVNLSWCLMQWHEKETEVRKGRGERMWEETRGKMRERRGERGSAPGAFPVISPSSPPS